MHNEGEEVHVSTDEARGGETGHGVRYVLGFGLSAVIIAMSLVWITGSLTGAHHSAQDATRVERPLVPDKVVPY